MAESSVKNGVPEVEKIREWLEETERLDEGIFSSIWRWLKRNLSPTARKLYKLADEFESELEAELRAEYGKIRDSKDLASKMRASYAGRISGDIEERMSIEAGDDDVYRDLARELVNERTLKAKKRVLGSFKGILDDGVRRRLATEWDDELEKSEGRIKKLFVGEEERYEKISNELSRMVESNKSLFSSVIRTLSQKEYMLRSVIAYAKFKAEKSGKEVTAKSAFEVAKAYAKLAKEMLAKLERLSEDKEELMTEIRRALNIIMTSSKPGDSMEAVAKKAEKEVEDALEGKSSQKEEEKDYELEDLEDEGVITPSSSKVIGKEAVEDAVEDAEKKTGKKSPSADDVADEVRETVSSYFEKNIGFITEDLNKKIEKFNSLDQKERSELQAKYNYNLNSEDKIEPAGEEEVKKLLEDFVSLVGSVVPYYEKSVAGIKIARTAVSKFIFEIYATKKNSSSRLTNEDRRKIFDAIKAKYKL